MPIPRRGQWLMVLQDFGHAPAFGCIAVAILAWLRASRPTSTVGQQYSIAFILTVVLGAATELAQFLVARDPSWYDLRSDIFGAAAFLGVAAAVDLRLRATLRAMWGVVALAVLTVHALPTIQMLRAYQHRTAAFPTLASFAEAIDLYFVQPQWSDIDLVSLPARYADHPGETALHVRLLPGDWPGVDFFEPAPDWRHFRTLALEIVNPTDAMLSLMLRTHDVHHNNEHSDRFNHTFDVPPQTRTTLRVSLVDIETAPRGRTMDTRRMADFLIFGKSDSAGAEFYLVSVRLDD
ncbi:VanZ family protein [Povalibacter sp.]|uniref:VanZ family protein n=1 Tax=Povalibacter sp. TaxID=1962978 RepID=UPI002F400DFD